MSEQWSSSGVAGDVGASSVSPAQTAAGKQAKGKPAGARAKTSGVQGTGTTVRAAGKPRNKSRRFKEAEEPSPQSDQDFAEVSRGRVTTGTRRGLMQSINKSSVSASTPAVAGSLAVVAGAAAAPDKRAPTPSQISVDVAAPCSMADMQTQDAHGQASAPDMEFRVNGVACWCVRVHVWLCVRMLYSVGAQPCVTRAGMCTNDSAPVCRAKTIALTAFHRCPPLRAMRYLQACLC